MRWILAGVLMLALAICVDKATQAANTAAWADVEAWIVADASEYGVSAAWLLSVAWCEARGNPYAVGAAGEVGPFQFHHQGIWWSLPASRMVPLDYTWESLRMQVRAAVRAFSRGLSWHWSCA